MMKTLFKDDNLLCMGAEPCKRNITYYCKYAENISRYYLSFPHIVYSLQHINYGHPSNRNFNRIRTIRLRIGLCESLEENFKIYFPPLYNVDYALGVCLGEDFNDNNVWQEIDRETLMRNTIREFWSTPFSSDINVFDNSGVGLPRTCSYLNFEVWHNKSKNPNWIPDVKESIEICDFNKFCQIYYGAPEGNFSLDNQLKLMRNR